MDTVLHVGIDVGSTTIKVIVLDKEYNIIFKEYTRHMSAVKATLTGMLENAQHILGSDLLLVSITGSLGLSLAKEADLPFVQEVIACQKAVRTIIPEADTIIELGGEDAKVSFLAFPPEQRMNNACAGGTGAFIDQMAVLLDTSPSGLNKLAKEYSTIHPIASRCGVFAKTDVQMLLNEGVSKEDIAASVFQAIVNQTIGALAQSRPLCGNVVLLGGPLHFLSELRHRFAVTLQAQRIMSPQDSEYFVALGAALFPSQNPISYEDLRGRITAALQASGTAEKLEPLFATKEEYENFRLRHAKYTALRGNCLRYQGKAYLGIDAGSTTTKMALVSEEGALIYSSYESNGGDALHSALAALRKLYDTVPDSVTIAGAAVIGYGEEIVKAALSVDSGEVETVAHLKAAKVFCPDADFVLDIGGQDMKSFFIKEGAIESIMLNEACSAGCGSFLESFAKSLHTDIRAFARLGLYAKQPVNLGSRCTVFMNSKIKQAVKEGYSLSDIAAGLAISVIKNALFKVIRMRSSEDLGKKIVVQGGAFYNDSVLRAFEKIAGREVVRPDIAGLMGAYGAAMIARERCGEKSQLISKEDIAGFRTQTKTKRCGLCPNNCLVMTKEFSTGRNFSSGYRCLRGLGQEAADGNLNMYRYKYQRLFQYSPLPPAEAKRGSIGLPRILNMYEDYPFWATFFTELGFRVVLSDCSSRSIYEAGIETIPADAVCYPAKLAHGHILNLIKKGVRKIFYPCIPVGWKGDEGGKNAYNCPIVAQYAEVIKANIGMLQSEKVQFYHPFLPIDNKPRLIERLQEELAAENLTKAALQTAVQKSYAELERYQEDVRKKGREILIYSQKTGTKGIVLAGQPYHIDPEINHGLADLIESYGLVVLSEDAVGEIMNSKRPLRVLDQWRYHSRLYAAADFVATQANLELVQLNSFGCGLDAVSMDQVKEILAAHNKIHTIIKLDEMNNTGTARIRIRSLLAALQERKRNITNSAYQHDRKVFTREMKKQHTIVLPEVSPIHFEFFLVILKKYGYQAVVTPLADKEAIELGLKYVHNDICYPAVVVIGQVLKMLLSGEYDTSKISVLLTQTGGPCRASNYIALLRKALADANLGEVPVISLSTGIEKNPGFKLSLSMLSDAIMGILYGDLLMRVLNRTRPYEKIPGAAKALYEKWAKCCQDALLEGGNLMFIRNIQGIVQDFSRLEVQKTIKPQVGIVGEIFLKYHPSANHYILDILEGAGAEVVVPDLTDFILYCIYDQKVKYDILAGPLTDKLGGMFFINIIELYRRKMKKELQNSRYFNAPTPIGELACQAARHVSLANLSGEGWLLVAEMADMIRHGVKNIICLQPFGCLPNHIMGKGMLKEFRSCYPDIQIMALDYDAGMSEVNLLNRIKLMLDNIKR